MTDVVTLSPGRIADPLETNRAFTNGGFGAGWVVSNLETLLADIVTALAAGPYNAFAESSGAASLTVTIDTGEAIVGSAAIARDVTTNVTLPASTSGITVSVGWSPTANDTIQIDRNANFTADTPKIPLWTYNTDGAGVTSVTDARNIGRQISVRNTRYEGDAVAVDEADHAAQATNASTAGNADRVDGRDVFVQNTEPANWDDGDLWFQPQ